MIRLERVVGALPARFDAMRAEAGGEGFRMLDVLAADWTAGKIRFDGDGEALLAGFVDDDLAGIGGLTIDPFMPDCLRMRRFYVRRAYRRLGVARAIAAALLARPETARKTITTNAAPGSEPLWEALGFVPERRERQTHILRW
jgi:GNAT superfamily N-acetyltransferase